MYILLINRYVKFHLKSSRVAEISTKFASAGTFYVHSVVHAF